MAYCTQSDIETIFGVTEIRTWADLENNGIVSLIIARIAASIVWAQDEVDDRLRRGPHEIPFTEPPPGKITSICAALAGVWLYKSRGVMDYNPDTGAAMHRHHWTEKDAYKSLREIRAGIIVLDLDDGPATAPEFVPYEDDEDDNQ